MVVDVIVSIAAAARQDDADKGSSGIAFAAVWSMLVLLALAIGGTNTLRRVRSLCFRPISNSGGFAVGRWC